MLWLRSIIFFLFLFIVTPLMAIICAPAVLVGEAASRACLRAWANLILISLKILCGVTYRVKGKEHIPEHGAIIAANHQSMWETISLFAILPRPVMVFKQELVNNPVYRIWAKYAGIAVDRKAGVRALHVLTKAAGEHIAAGRQIVLFPEGTRVNPGERRRFQSGAAAIYKALKAPCVPIAHNSGAHWRHPGPLKIPGEITIRILPPMDPGMDRKEFTAALEDMISKARPDLQPADNSTLHSQTPNALEPA